jgi:hypothetical protein
VTVTESDQAGGESEDEFAPDSQATRVARAYHLSTVEGWTVRDVAREFRVSTGTAHSLIAKGRKAALYLPALDLAERRAAAGDRLQAYRSILWKAIQDDMISPTELVKTALAVDAREAALFGLDAPAKVQTTAAAPEVDEDTIRAVREVQAAAARKRNAIEENFDGHDT